MKAVHCKLTTLFHRQRDGSKAAQPGHLFLDDAGYGQAANGAWHVYPPGGEPKMLDPKTHRVIDHNDGTHSIEGPAFAAGDDQVKLVKGEWQVQPSALAQQAQPASQPALAPLPAK